MMAQCAKHVYYQLPNELTHVNLLLDAIKYKDPGLNASIKVEKHDKGPSGKMNKFEDAAAYLTPWDHIVKKTTSIGNVVRLKILIHLEEEYKSQQPE